MFRKGKEKEDFIHIDDEIPIEQLSDEDILAAVIPTAENDDAEDDETPEEIDVITNREALKSLEKGNGKPLR
ncbi:18725_t:CDS:2, partial [Rhizophagus irregularis]